MQLSEQQFIDATRALARTVLDAYAAMGLDRDQAANMAAVAAGEIIAQQIGHFAAVTRLRDAADLMERQLLERTKQD